MDFLSFVKYFGFNSMFTFAIIFIGFVVGWVLYNKVILKDICLHDALFEKDNLAAWIEFIAAFIFPVLYLSSKAVVGSAHENIFMDLLICIGYALVYIILFTLLRLFSTQVVKTLSPKDHEGEIELNNEIYAQHNTSAAIFSTALSLIFVSIIQSFDFSSANVTQSFLKLFSVLVLTLLSLSLYTTILKSKTTLLKEIFVDNNTAAGVCFLGFAYAIELILCNAITMQKEFNFNELILVSAIGLIILGIFSFIFKKLFSKIIGIDFWKEIYKQNNIGAAIGQSALYISIANVIVNFLM